MYTVVQFSESEGGSLAIVANKWYTPQKKQVYWPPVTEKRHYEKLLRICASPEQRSWGLYEVQKVFFVANDLDKAKRKLELAEVTSDVQTEEEIKTNGACKRRIKKNNKYMSSDTDDDHDGELPRPPPLKKFLTTGLQSSGSSSGVKCHSSQVSQSVDITVDNNKNSLESPEPSPTTLLEHSTPISTMPECNNSICGFRDTIVSLLAHIKAQNSTILSILQERDYHSQQLKPEFKFPIENLEELKTIEDLLSVKENHANLVAYFKSLGGHGINNKVSRVMKTAFTDILASKFNFYGKKSNKKPFAELRLRSAVVDSLKSATITEKNIEDCVKVWLKHAPERAKKRLSITIGN